MRLTAKIEKLVEQKKAILAAIAENKELNFDAANKWSSLSARTRDISLQVDLGLIETKLQQAVRLEKLRDENKEATKKKKEDLKISLLEYELKTEIRTRQKIATTDKLISGYRELREERADEKELEKKLKASEEAAKKDPIESLVRSIMKGEKIISREEALKMAEEIQYGISGSKDAVEFDITRIKTTEQPEELISNEIPILTESSDSASSLDDVLGSILNSSVLKPGERVKIDEAIETVKVTNIENPL